MLLKFGLQHRRGRKGRVNMLRNPCGQRAAFGHLNNERGQFAPKSARGAAALSLKTAESKNKGVSICRIDRKISY